jgi:IclR family acetate operon transcriptional repressor
MVEIPKEGRRTPQRSQLKTVFAALDVLEYLGAHEGFVRLTDVNTALGFPKGRVHRILSTLAAREYVTQDPVSRGYALGVRTWLLGRQARTVRSLVDLVQPELDELCQASGETSLLAVLDDFSQITICTRRGSHPVHVFIREGARAPIHATSSGKAMLALLGDEYLEALCAQGLTRFTDRTIQDRKELGRQVEEARQRGFALATDEWAEGLSAVAAACRDGGSRTPMAITICFPTGRVSEARVTELGNLVKSKAEKVARFLDT